MDIILKDGKTGESIPATIRLAKPAELPSMHDGWRFNFNKLANKPYTKAYVVVTQANPDIIQGCMLLQMRPGSVAYISYI